MLERLPVRVLAVSGLVAPAAVMLLGLAVTAGGCAKEGEMAAPAPMSMAARLPVTSGHAKLGRRDLAARTLTAFANTGSVERRRGNGTGERVTPFEQLLGDGDRPLAMNGLCPPDMASVDDLYCVDKFEASLVEILPNGEERAWSAFMPVEGHTVRAVSEPHVYPQAYISGNQAAEACARSGKRLCKPREWTKACMGPSQVQYGYGAKDEPNRCNDHGRSPVVARYGGHANLGERGQWDWEKMNDPQLNQMERTLAKSGEYEGCTNDYGVHDMVGNIHEWVADPAGTFQGGYYQDVHENGDGCSYKTTAHAAWYHDYSTGFRCCADVAP